MIIEEEENIIDYWNNSERNLLIKARDGNGKTNKAKKIMNHMIKEGCSILLITNHRSSWVYGLDKSSRTLIGKCEFIINEPDVKREIDMLVIHDSHDTPDDFPIKSIKYKYILILSDEYGRVPSFFNGKVIRLIDWDNINNAVFGDDEDDTMVYGAVSDYEGNITLSKRSKQNESESLTFPVKVLKKMLLK